MSVQRKKWAAVVGFAALVVVALLALRTGLRVHAGLHPARFEIAAPPPPGAQAVQFHAAQRGEPDGGTRPLLRGWFTPSVNGATVILAHGHGQNRTQMLPEARTLTDAGFGVLLFDW